MINKDTLMNIGLTKNETDVYLFLLQTEESLAGEIAKKTGISRTYVYDTIEGLIQRGLVSYVIRNNKRFYRAAHPTKIIDYLKYQEENVSLLLPALLALHKPAASKPVVEVYDGKEGIKSIFATMFKVKPREWLALGSAGKSVEILGRDFVDILETRRAKLGIVMKIIMNLTEGSRKRGEQLRKFPLTHVRYIAETYDRPISTYVFGNYTAIVLWMKENPLAILIQNKDIARSFEKHFQIMWELSKKRYEA
jgi:sugar-specific transcriptional regulator TrmB